MLYLGRRSHELLGRYDGDTPSYVIQIYLVWGERGSKTEGKSGEKGSRRTINQNIKVIYGA